MRRLTLAVAVLALAACSKKDETPAVDTAAAAVTATPEVQPLSLSELAGEWNVVAKNDAGDSVLTSYVMNATADGNWTITFPNRAPIKAAASVSGDSVMTHAGPYASVLRKGVQVTTDAVMRLQDGKLIGKTTAHYNVKTADSIRIINSEGTRK